MCIYDMNHIYEVWMKNIEVKLLFAVVKQLKQLQRKPRTISNKASQLSWQSIALVSQRTWVQFSLRPQIFFWAFFATDLVASLQLQRSCTFTSKINIIHYYINIVKVILAGMTQLQIKPRKYSEASKGFKPMTSAMMVRCSTN